MTLLRPAALAQALALTALLALPAAWAADDPLLEYTISPRDTLIGLSSNVFESPRAWREIARLNGLRDPNRIYPGQVLKVIGKLPLLFVQ